MQTNTFYHNNKVINFVVPNLGANQLAYYLIHNINTFYEQRNDIDILTFYDDMQKYCLFPRFTVLHMASLWGQEGIAIATNFELAQRLLEIPGPTRKILYLWDLEWLRGRTMRPYALYRHIINNIDIVCRHESHAQVVKNGFNKNPIGIVNDCNIQQFLEVLKC